MALSMRTLAAVTVAIAGLVLAGCSGSDTAGGDSEASATGGSAGSVGTLDTSAAGEPSDGASGAGDSGAPVLKVASSPFGDIVVDGSGKTVYMFDKDTKGSGTSTCEGQCATAWPSVTSDSADPAVTGVTGEVGTITGVNGETQVTLDGWPLYYYIDDAAPGDTTGQGVGGVWWVLGADGSRITAAAEPTAASTAADDGGY